MGRNQQGSVQVLSESIPTRDGHHLATHVYLPDSAGAFPTVYMRTPFDTLSRLNLTLSHKLVSNGFAVVLQSVRGRYGSSGELEVVGPVEADDGIDTLQWIRDQLWANGRIGLMGFSYGAQIALATAAKETSDEGIQALVMIGGMANPYESIFPGGVLQLHWALPFSVILAGSVYEKVEGVSWQELYSYLPLNNVGQLIGRRLPTWDTFMAHQSYDDHWRERDPIPALRQTRVPGLHIWGTYDIFSPACLNTYRSLREGGAPQRLILGPWDHASVFRVLAGDASAPSAPSSGGQGGGASPNLFESVLSWFDQWLGEIPGGDSGEHPGGEPGEYPGGAASDSLYYIAPTGSWGSDSEWPPRHAEARALYLTHGGGLKSAAPAAAGSDSWVNNPLDPVPTLGGRIWPFRDNLPAPGPVNLGPLDGREDLLRYETAPLAEGVRLAGSPRLTLYASTDAVDADFHASLAARKPDGATILLAEGATRLNPTGGVPGGPGSQVVIDLGPLAYDFAPGDRIHLIVAGSNFPKHIRNLGLGGDVGAQVGGVEYRQTVYSGGAAGSWLELPLLGGLSFEE